MAEPALSLIAWMTEAGARAYLKQCCYLADKADGALRRHWNSARARIGPALLRGGDPEVIDMPLGYEAHLQRVVQSPAFRETVGAMSWSFRLVEVDPVIAFQTHIQIDRAANLCKNVEDGPNLDDMLPICLPAQLEKIPPSIQRSGSSVSVSSNSMNLRFEPISASGTPEIGELSVDNPRQVRTMGIRFFPAAPFVQVVRFHGRCFLRNGYHRVYGLAKAGATHVPCIYMEDAQDYSAVGLRANTLQPAVLESANPPTCNHFINDRAYPVQLLQATQTLKLTCSYAVNFSRR